MKTMKRMEKQQNPQRRSMKTSSIKLWMVELIQRRRCDMSTFQSSGAIVLAWASGQNFILYSGNRCVKNDRSEWMSGWANEERAHLEHEGGEVAILSERKQVLLAR